jgi:hypothetical protein
VSRLQHTHAGGASCITLYYLEIYRLQRKPFVTSFVQE